MNVYEKSQNSKRLRMAQEKPQWGPLSSLPRARNMVKSNPASVRGQPATVSLRLFIHD